MSNMENLETLISEGRIGYFRYSDFKNIKQIGEGAFGSVSRATLKNNTTLILALKSFNEDKQAHKEIVKELTIHRKVNIHENILRFHGITIIETDEMKKYSLVLEYADNGTLNEYLHCHFGELNWNDKLRLAFQLASAVECIHSYDIIHLDLHDKNILIHQKNIKLGDFGIAEESSNPSNSSKMFGIIPYIDPKRFNSNQQYQLNKKSDIYSIGILMWQISSGRRPFMDKNYDTKLSIAIFNGSREKIIHETPVEYSNLYEECWEYEPNNRPDIQKVVSALKSPEQDNVVNESPLEESKSDSDGLYLVSNEIGGYSQDNAVNKNKTTKFIQEINKSLQPILQIGKIGKQHNIVYELIEENYEKAIGSCCEYLERFPKNYSTICLLAYAYRCLNDYDQAHLYLNKAIKLKEKNPTAWYIDGEVFFRQSEYKEAISKLEVPRGFKVNISNLNIILGSSYLFQGMKSNSKSNYSINEYVLKIFNETHTKKSLRFRYCAYLYELKRDYFNTLTELKGLLGNKDSLISCYHGEILIKLGRYEEAISNFTEAYIIDPENVHNLSKRAITYHILGKYDDALLDLNKALQLNQSYNLAYYYRGLTLYTTQDIEGSISDFERYVQLDPNDMLGKMQLLYLEFFNNFKKLNDDIIAKIRQITNTDDRSLLFIRCKIYIESEEYIKALLDFNRLFELSYDDISFVYLLREYSDFWEYLCDYYNISDNEFTGLGIVENFDQYMYKERAVYFMSNLVNDHHSNSSSRKVLIVDNNEPMTFPKLSNIWWENIKYYIAWGICINSISSKDCFLNFTFEIGNEANIYQKKEHILEYEKLSKLIKLGWIEYIVPLKVESGSADWIVSSIEMKNGLIEMEIDYVRFMPYEKDSIYLPKADCLPIHKLQPNVPKVFEIQYFQKKEIENLLELNEILEYL